MTFSLFYFGFSSHFTIMFVFYGLLLIQLDSFHIHCKTQTLLLHAVIKTLGKKGSFMHFIKNLF